MDQEKVFGEVLERKEPYLDYAQYTMHNMHDYMHNTRCFKSALQSFALRRSGSRKSVW